MSSKTGKMSDLDRELLRDEIKQLGDEIRMLKQQKGDPNLIKERLAQMLAKKASLGEEASSKFVLKCPKGTRDYGPHQMAIRERVLDTVISAFKRHGAETIDTPVFELRDVLMGKYGEEGGKLVYDLGDQGGEQLSLRYDLTVPFARYLAMNKTTNIKRYHIAKVYRRDQPVMTRGRYREFYQCDFDIAGQYDPLIPDAECLKLVDEVLLALSLGDFETKLNHRLILEGMFAVCGVAANDFKTVCSSIDKLDKVDWATVREELIKEKNVPAEVADRLEQYVRIREFNPSFTNDQVLSQFRSNAQLMANASAMKGLEEMETLLKYCRLYGIEPRLAFDPALARGLDYYTGAIFETIFKDYTRAAMPKLTRNSASPIGDGSVEEVEESGPVGSVAAGGRYDKLVGMFAGAKKNAEVPCVGVSFGIERLFSIIEMKAKLDEQKIRTTETEVFVASPQKGLLEERMKLCRILWDANINTEMSYKANPKLLTQLQYCEERQIPIALLLGESEVKSGMVKLRDVKTRAEEDIPLAGIIDALRKKLEKC